ncbi:helix-turn-helix domain-containing protein [Kitasatospora sp. NPDC018058]|uniref:helix-turn-helix domain-containing protein n=1 Tax=Kitasatospora sp. NPDC018058 TaxID=3364025 RepID=UPI0037BF5A19
MTIGNSSDHENAPSSVEPTDDAVQAADAPSIGRVLSIARIEAGLTVDQVSTATRVRVPIVHAIESDDFGSCGGDFYARGHIRSIARAVGVDGEALVARYDAAHGGSPGVKRPAAQLVDSGPIRVPRRSRPNWAAAMVTAIVAVVVLIGFNLVSGKGGHGTTGSASAPLPSGSGTGSVAPATPTVQPSAPAPSAAAIAAVPADKVTVKLVAQGTSWVSAMDGDGKSLFQNNISDGQDQTFTDPKQIKLVLGNGGAVHAYVNGKDLGVLGKDGQVVHVTYTPGDPQAG